MRDIGPQRAASSFDKGAIPTGGEVPKGVMRKADGSGASHSVSSGYSSPPAQRTSSLAQGLIESLPSYLRPSRAGSAPQGALRGSVEVGEGGARAKPRSYTVPEHMMPKPGELEELMQEFDEPLASPSQPRVEQTRTGAAPQRADAAVAKPSQQMKPVGAVLAQVDKELQDSQKVREQLTGLRGSGRRDVSEALANDVKEAKSAFTKAQAHLELAHEFHPPTGPRSDTNDRLARAQAQAARAANSYFVLLNLRIELRRNNPNGDFSRLDPLIDEAKKQFQKVDQNATSMPRMARVATSQAEAVMQSMEQENEEAVQKLISMIEPFTRQGERRT